MKIDLKTALRDRKISVSELSENSGIGRTTISKLNNTKELPENTKLSTISKICKVLNIPIAELLSFNEYTIAPERYVKFGDDLVDGFLVIKITDTNGVNCFAYFANIKQTAFEYEIEMKYESNIEKLKERYITKLKDFDVSVDLNSEFDFDSKISDFPELGSDYLNEMQKIHSSFLAKYPRYINSVSLSLMQEQEIENLRIKYPESFKELSKYPTQRINLIGSFVKDNQFLAVTPKIREIIENESDYKFLRTKYNVYLGETSIGEPRNLYMITTDKDTIVDAHNQARLSARMNTI